MKIIIKASSGLSNNEKLCVLVQEMERDRKEICLLKKGEICIIRKYFMQG